TFSHLPWYADHPSDPMIRHEAYLTRVVLPLVEKNYPAIPGRAGRLLVGFSKSGWGAFTLLLRNPEVFAAAAAFDAPLALDRPGPYGSGPIFGRRENFEKYRVESLLKKNAGRLGSSKRLALLGHFVNFRKQHEKARSWMNSLKIQHHWHKGQRWKHSWESGWLPRAIELIAGDDKVQPEGNQLRE
ncbi:MAG: esterase family protein, partial [Planctomycetes bacterium]|nr:esterase family protein [Planctomycetota bacterium]